MVLMVSFNSRISPRTSTVIFLDKSPLATAVVTSAILRTWLVRLEAIELNGSVKSFHGPPPPRTRRLATGFAFGPPSGSHASHFGGKRPELIHHRVHGVLEFQDFAAHI